MTVFYIVCIIYILIFFSGSRKTVEGTLGAVIFQLIVIIFLQIVGELTFLDYVTVEVLKFQTLIVGAIGLDKQGRPRSDF